VVQHSNILLRALLKFLTPVTLGLLAISLGLVRAVPTTAFTYQCPSCNCNAEYTLPVDSECRFVGSNIVSFGLSDPNSDLQCQIFLGDDCSGNPVQTVGIHSKQTFGCTANQNPTVDVSMRCF
jgi:hypothetical protein